MRFLAHLVAALHLTIIAINLAAIPLVIIYEPLYIAVPIISALVSPVMGGTYCMFNRLENHFRYLAGMPLITDRVPALFKQGLIYRDDNHV